MMYRFNGQLFTLSFGILSIAAVLLTGCHLIPAPVVELPPEYETRQPVDYYLSEHFFRTKPSRVVLMVPEARDTSFDLQTRFAKVVAKKLVSLGVFEILPNTEYCDLDVASIRNGNFDERHVLQLAKEHNADGILFCEVNEFSAYEPLHLGCTLTFVDTRESIVTLHTNGLWDATDDGVQGKFLQHVCRIHRCKKYAAGVYTQSPSEFMDFVATDLTGFIQETIHSEYRRLRSARGVPPSFR